MEPSKNTDKVTHYSILLAPFQPITRIELETHVNAIAECCLDIRNTADRTLNVTITKAPVAERHITLNPVELEINGKSAGTITIKWSPKEAGAWRDVIQLTDSRRIKYDIVLVTISKNVRKTIKIQKRPQQLSLLKSSNLPVTATNKKFQQNDVSLKVPIINRSVSTDSNLRMQQYKPIHENSGNKENISCKYKEPKIYISGEKENIAKGFHHYEYPKSDVLSEQHMNVWNDGSILPQALPPSKTLQEIRRATYIKETRHCEGLLYEYNEEENKYAVRPKDKPQSDFSILINKFAFTPADLIPNSPQPTRNESIESTSFQNTDKHKTFNISHSQFFETTASCDTKNTNTLSVQQSLDLYNLSPIKSDRSSFISDMKNLIASSPIACSQQSDTLKDPNECLKYSKLEMNSINKINDYEYFSFDTIPKNIKTLEKGDNIYIEISPPRKYSHFKSPITSKLFTTKSGKITKSQNRIFSEAGKRFLLNTSTKKKSTGNVPAIRINKLSLNNLRKTKWHVSNLTESSIKMYNKEESFQQSFEADFYAPFFMEDPFLKNTTHHDNQWLLQKEFAFTKWLNVLLSSPEDLSVDIESTVADVGKIWQLCNAQKNAVLAETKETVSARYHTSTRLNILRKAARVLFNNNDVTKVLLRATTCITKGILLIKSDCNLHRDIGLQKFVLGLFLSYNPLWLRIGLETIYDERIPLRSNNDIEGLSRFLITRFFSDPRLIKLHGYHKTDPNKKFITQLNQFILKKFLSLVYFLDYAKQHKLIYHDPCLFYKRATYKSSREILLSFSRELLSGIGDITKLLRSYDYVLIYRQTFIEEYDYAVIDIRRELRDGVRLCRVVELITGIRKLTQSCRTPAISRLQKVHNVNVALNALREAGCILSDDIDAKSIADGHRERTLSLLWQIIHKYEAPKFNRAARVIQRWWRAQLWYVFTKKYVYTRRNNAAITIQRAWKRRKTEVWQVERRSCDLEERKVFLRTRRAAIHLQRWWRQLRENMERLHKLRNKRKIVIALQRRWRATLQMRIQRNQYCKLENATLTIQRYWRAKQMMKLQRLEYLSSRNAVIRLQLWWRLVKITRNQRECFLRSKESVRIIQIWWRRHLLVRKERNDFLRKISAVLTIQKWWISIINKRCKQQAASKIQAWWRTMMCLRKYKLQKSCCIKIQRWWRRIKLFKHERAEFLQLRNAAMIVQKNWRMIITRRHYLTQRTAASLICLWYRRMKVQKPIRQHYLKTRYATIIIQIWWRNIIVARAERMQYLRLRENVLFLQNYWRRRVLARTDRQQYILKRKACVIIQNWWQMVRIYKEYKRLKTCVIRIQRKWRAIKVARAIKKEYLLTHKAAVVIQSYYRMKITVRRYETMKHAALIIQSHWRAYLARKYEREQAAISMQLHYEQENIKNNYKNLIRKEDIVAIATKIQNECGDATEINSDVANGLAFLDSDYWQKIISVFRNCSTVDMLLTCLSSLDTITKLSPTVCIILCEMNLVDEIYKNIAQNNRSLPWMNVCLRSCSILITLANYSYTRKYIVKKEYALSLVKLLSRTLKEREVFLHCATLIWLISQDEDYLKFMATCPQIRWFLKGIRQKSAAKFQKSKELDKLPPNCEPNRNNTQTSRVFTDMNLAIAAIIKKMCT